MFMNEVRGQFCVAITFWIVFGRFLARIAVETLAILAVFLSPSLQMPELYLDYSATAFVFFFKFSLIYYLTISLKFDTV
jgi:hypothetical protein